MKFGEREQKILDFERNWNSAAGRSSVNKAVAIKNELGISSTTYYRKRNQLIDSREALAYDPLWVSRMKKTRRELMNFLFFGRPAHEWRRRRSSVEPQESAQPGATTAKGINDVLAKRKIGPADPSTDNAANSTTVENARSDEQGESKDGSRANVAPKGVTFLEKRAR